MSGRGRYQSGRGGCFKSSGRGSGRGYKSNSDSYSKKNNNNNKSGSGNGGTAEMKFVPHYTGKQQTMTYDTVKDHIIQQIQKTYKYGLDMAKTLREMEYN